MKRMHPLMFVVFLPVLMAAINAATQWNIQTDGSDTNGGGFKAGASGTDYSLVAAKRTGQANNNSVTDVVSTGTTVLSSATGTITSALVGNIVYLSGGSGTLTGTWREVTAAGTGTFTVDANVGTGTNITCNIGGALLTPNQAGTIATNGNTINIKVGTYSIGTNIVCADANYNIQSVVRGYTSTYADGGRPTLQAAAGVTTVLSHAANGDWSFLDLIVDCNNIASIGINNQNDYSANVSRCKVINFKQYGIYAKCIVEACEVAGGAAGATAGISNSSNGLSLNCWSHNNACTGIMGQAVGCIANNNTGTTSDGIGATGSAMQLVVRNTIYGNGRHGINFSGFAMGPIARDNIVVSNGSYGISSNGGHKNTLDSNAFYGNTATTNIMGVSSILLSADPFVNSASADFRLNSIAGAGAACKAVGLIAPTFTSNQDLGALQHQDISPSLLSRLANQP